MRSLVVYSSQTGNTKRLAEAIYGAIPGEKEIYPCQSAPDPGDYDFIAVGFWFKAGKPDPDAQTFLKKIVEQSVFLFATHGAGDDSQHAEEGMEEAKALIPEAEISGSFHCQGEVDPETLSAVREKSNPPDWIADAEKAAGRPAGDDLNRAQEALKVAIGIG
jgi:flavodoxin